jgi:galactokinase
MDDDNAIVEPATLKEHGYVHPWSEGLDQGSWEALTDAFAECFADEKGKEVSRNPLFVARAPGRINLIGEHVDYCEGLVLPCATDLDLKLVCRARTDQLVRCASSTSTTTSGGDEGQVYEWDVTVPLSEAREKEEDSAASALPRFMDLVLGQGAFFNRQAEGAICGFDCLIVSDIPIGAGLSSSSALCVAAALAFEHVNAAMRGAKCTKRQRLERVCTSEWFHSGVRGGIMDQYTQLFAEDNGFVLLDCRVQVHTAVVELGDAHSLIIADTQARHDLVGSPYNDRRASCEAALEKVKAHFPNLRLQSLRDVSMPMLHSCKWAGRTTLVDRVYRTEALSLEEYRHARHVVSEIERTVRCVAALEAGDLKRVGALLNESHASLRDEYEVSCEESDVLCRLATECKGVLGARMMGAGFGGCCVVLCEKDKCAAVEAELSKGFQQATSVEPTLYRVSSPGRRACVYV